MLVKGAALIELDGSEILIRPTADGGVNVIDLTESQISELTPAEARCLATTLMDAADAVEKIGSFAE